MYFFAFNLDSKVSPQRNLHTKCGVICMDASFSVKPYAEFGERNGVAWHCVLIFIVLAGVEHSCTGKH